jgi:hypothetical protein
MVLLDLRMHWASVDCLGRRRRHPSRIAFECHPALGAITRFVAHDALAHWAEVFCALPGLNVAVMRVVAVLVAICVISMLAGGVIVFHGDG